MAKWLVRSTTKLVTQVRFQVAVGLSTDYFSAGWLPNRVLLPAVSA